jgi:hypothetical protein
VPAAFRISSAGATAWLGQDGFALDLQRGDGAAAPGDGPGTGEPMRVTSAHARLSFVDAAPTRPIGEALHTARAHFYLGNDPKAWRTNVPMFSAVRWSQTWPGIDVRARTHEHGLLEFELEVAAGADPCTAVLRWEGVEAIERHEDGALRLLTAAGALLQSAPVAWQPAADGTQLPIPVAVELLDEGRFRFCVDVVRADLPVVIDPVLTYHGGSGNEVAHGVARDAGGRVVVAGISDSPPTAGGLDVLVSCLDFTLPWPHIVWTTTIGGGLDDRAFDVDADVAGYFTVVGGTFSTNFPTTPGVPHPLFRGGLLDGFVLQLDSSGALSFSTYYGGLGNDWCCRVEMNAQLEATIGGYSDSTNLPTVNPYQPTNAGLRDAFVVRFAPFGTGHVYATYLGGGNNEGFLNLTSPTGPFDGDNRILGLDLDATGRVLLSGYTTSGNYPTLNALQPGLAGGADAFVTILDPSQPPGPPQLVYSTYLGGVLSDGGMAARFGPGSTLVVGGYTYSSNFPFTVGSYQPTFIGPASFNDAFLVFLDPSLIPTAQLIYGTFFGGTSTTAVVHYDSVQGLSVDSRGHVTVVGFCCGDTLWPVHVGAFQPVHGGIRDGFVLRLRRLGTGITALTYATFLGGLSNDVLLDVEPEPDGGVAIAGRAASFGIPGVSGALNGVQDALVCKLEILPVGVQRGDGSSSYCAGGPYLGTVMLEVDQKPVAGATFNYLVGGAPPNWFGVLGLGFGTPPPGVPYGGALICLGPPPVLLFLASSPLGAASLPLSVPPGWPVPIGVHAQAVWLAPATCTLPLTSSATLSK